MNETSLSVFEIADGIKPGGRFLDKYGITDWPELEGK